MALWVKALAAKSNDLSSIPRIHMVEGENQCQVVLQPPYMHPGRCIQIDRWMDEWIYGWMDSQTDK